MRALVLLLLWAALSAALSTATASGLSTASAALAEAAAPVPVPFNQQLTVQAVAGRVRKLSCAVSKATVRLDPRSVANTMRDEDIIALIGNARSLHWVNVNQHTFACVDGRYTDEVLSTYGADMGELIVALNVYEELTGNRLESQDIMDILTDFLRTTNKQAFTMCTDTAALSQLQAALNLGSLNIRNPPQDRRSDIMELVADISPTTGAYTTGCRHLRFMLENPAEYNVRPRLIQNAVHAFYALLWNGHPKIKLDVLHGKHSELAEVHIATGRECLERGVAPTVTPNTNTASMYITHTAAVQLYRQELAQFIASRCPRLEMLNLFHGINVRAGLHRMSTVSRISATLPTYDVTFD